MEYKKYGEFTAQEMRQLDTIVSKQQPVKIMTCGENVILQINKSDLNSIKIALRHYCNEAYTLALLRRIEIAQDAC